MELIFWKIPPMAWFVYYNFPRSEYSFNLSDTHVKYLTVPSRILAGTWRWRWSIPFPEPTAVTAIYCAGSENYFCDQCTRWIFPTSGLDICKKIGSSFHAKFPVYTKVRTVMVIKWWWRDRRWLSRWQAGSSTEGIVSVFGDQSMLPPPTPYEAVLEP